MQIKNLLIAAGFVLSLTAAAPVYAWSARETWNNARSTFSESWRTFKETFNGSGPTRTITTNDVRFTYTYRPVSTIPNCGARCERLIRSNRPQSLAWARNDQTSGDGGRTWSSPTYGSLSDASGMGDQND